MHFMRETLFHGFTDWLDEVSPRDTAHKERYEIHERARPRSVYIWQTGVASVGSKALILMLNASVVDGTLPFR